MDLKVVEDGFFNRLTRNVARQLLGCYLVHETSEGRTVGRIVEVEAYLGAQDAAAHSYKGRTARTKAMFGPAGHAYIYFSYGMHYCLNVTAGEIGIGEGILLRALEPVEGIELMRLRRLTQLDQSLANGPGKLVQAMGVTKELYGHDLTSPPLYICYGRVEDREVMAGPRVGISRAVELPLRFYIKGSQWTSGKRGFS